MITESMLAEGIANRTISPEGGLDLLRSDQVKLGRREREKEDPTLADIERQGWQSTTLYYMLDLVGAPESMHDAYSTELARLIRIQYPGVLD